MKKLLCVLLCMFLLCSFAGCDDTEDPDAETTTSATTTATTAPPVSATTLEKAYEDATKQFELYPETQRNIGDLQPETREILVINGKYYQSYVSGASNLRYIFIHQSEYSMSATWNWMPIGTANTYSLELLGRIDEGYR